MNPMMSASEDGMNTASGASANIYRPASNGGVVNTQTWMMGAVIVVLAVIALRK